MNTQMNTYPTYNAIPLHTPVQINNVIPFRARDTKHTDLDTILNNLTQDDTDDFDKDIKTRHDAEPFKSKDDVNKILTYFLDRHMKSWNTAQRQPSRKWNPRYLRNYMLFQIGCNCGLRASDLTKLQIGHFIDKQNKYRDTTEIVEKKTLHTRKTLKTRTIDVNDGIISTIELYKKYHPDWTRQDYLFPNGYDLDGKPNTETITRQNMDLIIKDVVSKVGLNMRASTHSLRKYFGREFILQNGNNERAILMAQIIYGHSSQSSTKHYLGLTRDEIRNGCMGLNIGFTNEELKQMGV